jgi:hypothetical protein
MEVIMAKFTEAEERSIVANWCNGRKSSKKANYFQICRMCRKYGINPNAKWLKDYGVTARNLKAYKDSGFHGSYKSWSHRSGADDGRTRRGRSSHSGYNNEYWFGQHPILILVIIVIIVLYYMSH